MHREQLDVLDFHAAMDQEVLSTPAVPRPEVVYLRARLVTEEFAEFVAALSGADDAGKERLITFLQEFVKAYFFGRSVVPDIVDLADSIADLKYVLEGTNLAFGIDGAPIWDAVHEANMKKAGGPVSPEGKRLKPPGWTPPDIRGLLLKQGWTPS